MILLITSRRPTKRIKSFCHDVECLIPDAVCKVPRGKLDEIIPTSESTLGGSMNLRSPDKEIFWSLLQWIGSQPKSSEN